MSTAAGQSDPEDDAALAWAGDEKLAPEPTKPLVDSADAPTETPRGAPKAMPAALLVTYGIIAGIYLIYTLGWIISVTRSTVTQIDLLAEIMYQFGQFLAISSPAIWFVTVLYLTRGRKPVVRLLFLVAGLAATVPWPLLLGM